MNADRPVSKKEQDRFKRYPFAKRIAETIVNRKVEDSLVVGLYAGWGEGKTSVTNFITTELSTHEQVVVMKFNPWRYKSEDELLMQYFVQLTAVVGAKLKNSSEKFGAYIGRLGQLLQIDMAGFKPAKILQSFSDLLNETDVERLKDRVGYLLAEQGKKAVIFIDDIDRLEKSEIQAIFRLIKLTADFPYTVYILCLDEQKVAAAIAERFAGGNDTRSGMEFLEKIVQVPLKVPQAEPEMLRDFCIELINNALEANNIEIDESEANRFADIFGSSIMPSITTPRMAIRYANSLTFSLPLLKGEANMVDLMLLEGIKIFYPDGYELLKEYSELFIGSYTDPFSQGRDEKKINQIKALIEDAGGKQSERGKKALKNLFTSLFPKIKDAYFNETNVHQEKLNYQQKRIANPGYFSRYLTYSVTTGEISDTLFAELLDSITTATEDEIVKKIKNLIESASVDKFIFKIRAWEADLPWEKAKRLCYIMAKHSDIIPATTASFFMGPFLTPRGQATIFISQVLMNHKNMQARFELAKELIQIANPFDFANTLHRNFNYGKKKEDLLFSPEKFQELTMQLIQRAVAQANDLALWEALPNDAYRILTLWHEIEPGTVTEYILDHINRKKDLMLTLLDAFVSHIHSSLYPGAYESDLNEEGYKMIAALIPADLMSEYLIEKYTPESLQTNEEIIWDNDKKGPFQTPINKARQFMYWHGRTGGQATSVEQ